MGQFFFRKVLSFLLGFLVVVWDGRFLVFGGFLGCYFCGKCVGLIGFFFLFILMGNLIFIRLK